MNAIHLPKYLIASFLGGPNTTLKVPFLADTVQQWRAYFTWNWNLVTATSFLIIVLTCFKCRDCSSTAMKFAKVSPKR